ncbi:hypothetical protein [Caballeronia sp. LZ035]|uniref:hypothetical protein n=1 Tax=Caballeronia sp. LZ035 TaxID=3038568 RepID=UPI002862FD5B|nr:hypothetical protein [Caballeronia sp. LZ035]MDR5758199.1 hypothetical protein [Caballeronia sp. LZ035]
MMANSQKVIISTRDRARCRLATALTVRVAQRLGAFNMARAMKAAKQPNVSATLKSTHKWFDAEHQVYTHISENEISIEFWRDKSTGLFDMTLYRANDDVWLVTIPTECRYPTGWWIPADRTEILANALEREPVYFGLRSDRIAVMAVRAPKTGPSTKQNASEWVARTAAVKRWRISPQYERERAREFMAQTIEQIEKAGA